MTAAAWTAPSWNVLIDAFNQHVLLWRAFAHDHLLTSVGLFVLAYAGAVATLLPVALVMTTLGGFLFGAWTATAASVAGASLGGMLSYGLARWLLADRLRARFADDPGKLGRLIKNARAGAFGYVFTLRLLPMAPFGLVSMAAGAGEMPAGLYLAATALGIIPECALYALAGQGLRAVADEGMQVGWRDFARPESVTPLLGFAGLAFILLALRWLWRGRAAARQALLDETEPH